jgi:hypothetical protein
MQNEYVTVTPTEAELAEWVRHYGPRQRPPYRIVCSICGKRLWLTGLGLGAHRRSIRHRDARSAS